MDWLTFWCHEQENGKKLRGAKTIFDILLLHFRTWYLFVKPFVFHFVKYYLTLGTYLGLGQVVTASVPLPRCLQFEARCHIIVGYKPKRPWLAPYFKNTNRRIIPSQTLWTIFWSQSKKLFQSSLKNIFWVQLFSSIKMLNLGRGCGSVGRAVASDTRDL